MKDKCRERKLEDSTRDLVKTADTRHFLVKTGTKKRGYRFYNFTPIIEDTLSNFRIKDLEKSVKKTQHLNFLLNLRKKSLFFQNNF